MLEQTSRDIGTRPPRHDAPTAQEQHNTPAERTIPKECTTPEERTPTEPGTTSALTHDQPPTSPNARAEATRPSLGCPRPRWQLFLWWGAAFATLVGVLLTSWQVRSRQPSCHLKDVVPYSFPLARPLKPKGSAVQPDWVQRPNRPFMRGVSLGLYFKDQRFDYDLFLRDIKRMGASHVGFVISWYQANVRSNSINRHPQKTVSDARLITTIHQARARGLQVFLLPIVRLQHRGDDDWRGVIKPTDMDAWWRSYRSYIMHYADISHRHGVELFSVGSELVSMEKRKDRWLALIRNVRRLFRGQLVYSANWDHYEPVTFWESLNYIGISNYYELSKQILPGVDTLRKAWSRIRTKIENWKKRYPRQQLMFTEVGYYSQKGTNIYPWDYTRDKAISLEEQRRCYQAFIDVWGQSKSLNGTFFWNWFSKGGPKDKGYTPRGKPAECELRHWYRRLRRRDARTPSRPWQAARPMPKPQPTRPGPKASSWFQWQGSPAPPRRRTRSTHRTTHKPQRRAPHRSNP